MRSSSRLGGVRPALACLAILLTPQVTIARQPQAGAASADRLSPIVDIALGPENTLRGQVVDAEGIPVAGAAVALLQGPRPAARTTTDAGGHFLFSEVPGGVYGLATPGAGGIYRLWAPETAPPSANRGALIVAPGAALRGQCRGWNWQGRVYEWVSEHYLITYTAIAAAIVIPIVEIADDDDASPASP